MNPGLGRGCGNYHTTSVAPAAKIPQTIGPGAENEPAKKLEGRRKSRWKVWFCGAERAHFGMRSPSFLSPSASANDPKWQGCLIVMQKDACFEHPLSISGEDVGQKLGKNASQKSNSEASKQAWAWALLFV